MSDTKKETTELSNIVWIKLPEQFAKSIGNFKLDPSIPIPVETNSKGTFTPESLSLETLLSGMLKALSADPFMNNGDYYRTFVATMRPNILGELSEAGILKAKNHDYDAAEEIFLAIIGLMPAAPAPRLNLAVAYEDRAEYYAKLGKSDLEEKYSDAAFEMFKKLLDLVPKFPDAYFNAGFFYLRKRNYEKARDLFIEYTKIGDDEEKLNRARELAKKLDRQAYLDVLFKEAYDFVSIGQEETGLVKINEFLVNYPNVWNAHFIKGWALRRLKRWAEGEKALQEAVKLGSGDVDTLNELSICLLEQGKTKEAKKCLEDALAQENDNIKIICNLGIIAQKEGKISEARGFFLTALDMEPNDEIAKAYLASLDA